MSNPATGPAFCAGQTQAMADAACQAALGVPARMTFTQGATTYVVEDYPKKDCGYFGVWQGTTLEAKTCKVGDCHCQ